MTITAAQLQPFCSTDPVRPFLHKPWTRDGYTYATNGHELLVKGPGLADVPENPKAPDCEWVIAPTLAQTEFAPLPSFRIPQARTIECKYCDGRGYQHGCPYCICECQKCDGSGEWDEPISVTLFGAIYNARSIALIRALPGLQFSSSPPPDGPARFTFGKGWVGLIMPRKCPAFRHIEIGQ